jgi:hypothetical protein
LTGKFDLTNVNNMAFYISGSKLLFETTEISTYPNSTQQESNYIYLYTTKFGTSIKIRLNRKFESTEFETMRVNCICKPERTMQYTHGLIWTSQTILTSSFEQVSCNKLTSSFEEATHTQWWMTQSSPSGLPLSHLIPKFRYH